MLSLSKFKKAEVELDHLVKIIIAVIVLIVLIVIITMYIGGEFGVQGERLKDAFDFFK